MTAQHIRPGVVFELARALDSVPADLKLRNVEWGMLFAVTGEHTVAQIGSHFGLAAEERDRAFARLAETGLISEREVTIGEYLKVAATIPDDQPKTLARFLRAGAAPIAGGEADRPAPKTEPSPPEPQSQRAPRPKAAPRPPRVSRSSTAPPPQGPKVETAASKAPMLDDNLTRAVPIASAVDFEPLTGPLPQAPQATGNRQPRIGEAATKAPSAAKLPAPTPTGAARPTPSGATSRPTAPNQEAANTRRLSLKALMQFILDRAHDPTSGQLDVYRVFIRVNTRLLKRNGIDTLRFSEDRLIGDPELQQAITSSVRKTLGVNCPSQVFV